MDSIQTNNSDWKFYVLELSETNYFNPKHQIVRVKYKGKRIDLRINPGIENPSPQDHLVLVIAPEKTMEYEEVDSDRYFLSPGTISTDGDLGEIQQGICFLIDKKQRVNTTAPQNGQAGFSVSSTNMFDQENVVAVMSPRMVDRDYTSIDPQGQDPNYGSIGIFMNRDGCILIKSTGSSITMGKEGIHIGGRLFLESSARETGPLSDNTISDLIGSTIPTAGASWPKLPNIGQIAQYANAGMKFIKIVDAAKSGIELVRNIGNIV